MNRDNALLRKINSMVNASSLSVEPGYDFDIDEILSEFNSQFIEESCLDDIDSDS